MSMFANAKPLEKPTAAPKAGSAKHRKQLADLETYAQLDVLIKAATGLMATLGGEVKAEAMAEFMRLGKNGVRPESFEGFEGNATASVELRKRSSASVLTADEAAELTKLGLPIETVRTQVKMFGINPVFTEDMGLLSKVEAALKGVVPEGFFVVQEEVTKQVVSDETIAQAFAKHADSQVVKMITVQALKPKLAVSDLRAVLKAVTPMLTGESDAEAATKARAK